MRPLSGQPVQVQLIGDSRFAWLNESVPCVRRPFGMDRPSERPAGPRTPTTLLATGFIHPVGVVLEMHARVADEDMWRSVG